MAQSVSVGSSKARPLRPGDTVGIIAPAGRIDPGSLAPALTRLRSWGFKTRVGEHVTARFGYFAGSDIERLADFHAIWSDPQVAAVLCARGGHGTMRLLRHIDWDLIRSHPKFFCGFSAITALHLALEREAGLVTFHGPMAVAFGDAITYNTAGLRKALTLAGPLGDIPWPAKAAGARVPTPTIIHPGVGEGRTIGGNLSLLAALMGTRWEPDFTGRLVLIEEVREAPHRVNRMLTQLLLGGTLPRAAGIGFGWSPSCMHDPQGEPSLTLVQVLNELLDPLGIPVLYGLPFGHEQHRATIPLGVQARLDADAARLTILEGALCTEPTR